MDLRRQIEALIEAPSERDKFNQWLKQRDALGFLEENVYSNEILIYASLPYMFVNSVFVPKTNLDLLDIDDLLQWSLNPDDTWSVWTSADEVGIAPPLDDPGCETLKGSEQLLISRSFEGRLGDKWYFELLQKFAHIADLHYVPERRAWCKIDRHGDVVDLVRVVDIPARGEKRGGRYVSAARELFDEYTYLTQAALVRLFDFTRVRYGGFPGWSDAREESRITTENMHAKLTIDPEIGSYSRGFQLLETRTTKEKIIKRMWGREDEDQQFATFIAHDWKNKVVKEISCDSKCLGNYFTKSDLPFGTSPAFFRPDALLKYKSDSEKYTLEERSISCRGAWHLKTYDINEAGQVHTYLIYLSSLPYQEQLHWKSYNEAPRAPISKRAFTTDFEGNFSSEMDSLNKLKRELRELYKQGVPWWTLRSDELMEKAHAPFTQAADEWANDVLALDQMLVEGFEPKWLRQKAVSLGRSPNTSFGSLKLVEECLVGLKFEEHDARNVIAPLRELHELRTKLKGHVSIEFRPGA